MEEQWAEIPGFDGRYSVSSSGNVRANWTDVPRRGCGKRVRVEKSYLLQPFVHTTGYMRVSLGRGVSRYVHRLVAAAFLPNPDHLPQVDHRDGNRQHNAVSNLQWVSAKQNAVLGGQRHEWAAQKAAAVARRIHDLRVEEYRVLLDQGCSLRAIARAFQTSHAAIAAALRRSDQSR